MFSYEDAQCEFPERLVAEWLVEAMEAGAVARNHTQVLAVDVRHRRVAGVLLRDQLSGKEERVEATWIINATGPWADRMCQRSRIETPHPMVGGIRGSHIVLPRFAGAPDAAVYTEAVDKRPIFVIPWNEQVLVGTTEVADQGDPGKVQPSPEEIDYLMRSFVHLFPQVKLSAADIRYTFAGVRPLPFAPKENAGAVTRKHYLHDHAAGRRRAHDFRDWRQADYGCGTGASMCSQRLECRQNLRRRSPSPRRKAQRCCWTSG